MPSVKGRILLSYGPSNLCLQNGSISVICALAWVSVVSREGSVLKHITPVSEVVGGVAGHNYGQEHQHQSNAPNGNGSVGEVAAPIFVGVPRYACGRRGAWDTAVCARASKFPTLNNKHCLRSSHGLEEVRRT